MSDILHREGAPSPSDADPAIPLSDHAGPPQRVVIRMVLEFILTMLAAGAKAHEADLKAMILFMAIQHANIEHLLADPKHGESFLDGYPDDDLRRPITTHALSQSITLPPETCRRYVQRLIAQGYCRRAGLRGVIVPSEVMVRAPFSKVVDTAYDAFISMLKDLRTIGFDVLEVAGVKATDAEKQPPQALKYLLSSVATGYVMRVIWDAVDQHAKDFVRALIFTAVMTMNVEEITHNADAAWRFAGAYTPPPDDMRAPVSVQAVCDRTGFPYETTRQHLIRMVDLGRAKRVGGGFIIPSAVMQEPDIVKTGFNIYMWLLRAVAQLDRLGFDFHAALSSGQTDLQGV